MPMYLHVVLRRLVYFMWAKDVVKHGVGHAVRNTAGNIMTRLRVKDYPRQRMAMMPPVVSKRLVLKRKSIVAEGILVTAVKDGKYLYCN